MPSRSLHQPHTRAARGAGRNGSRRNFPAVPAVGVRRRVTIEAPPRDGRAGVLPRSSSETALWTLRSPPSGDGARGDDDGPGGIRILRRHYTFTEFCPATPAIPFSPSPPRHVVEGGSNGGDAKSDLKVLLTVTVEGSPGPVRAMVRLGASVEEAIGAVVDVYGREGRSPRLDAAAVPCLQLHHNHFCLQSLNKGDTLGQVGGRNFYLRRSPGGEATSARGGQEEGSCPQPLLPLSGHHFLAMIAGRVCKFSRKLRKLWRALGCVTCG